ncbi:hypothetical protein RF11_08371 [Thelohanellus kitauei]|uniref:Uncharacterized protein n=1 Tax=Thelohanellus kitauei TaxID=669202 RepID=A0A0C2MY17_THEKT|nr:hypothetical protein RF11_08371 [Thelohanellus kitauei]
MFEDIKSTIIPMISDDFIKHVFSSCQTYLFETHTINLFDVSEHLKFNKYRCVMAKLIQLFNKSNVHDTLKAIDRILLCHTDSTASSMSYSTNDSGSVSVSNLISHNTSTARKRDKSSILGLLSLFTLIFELKFIFGHITSTIDNFNF